MKYNAVPLKAFSDAYYDMDPEQITSTSVAVIKFHESPVVCFSELQKLMRKSSTES